LLDPNHKPEMAIALSPFLAFLNFLPLPTLLLHLLTVPELDPLIPSDLTSSLATSLTLPSTRPPDAFLFEPVISAPTEAQRNILKQIFGALMTTPTELVKSSISALVERYKSGEKVAESEKGLVDLALMLDEQYPGDVGVLCVFMLNVVELERGEAAFLGAGMPHAYIKGGTRPSSAPEAPPDEDIDIIECMATSDNVIRAGLTPKLRDVDTLISMLTYDAGPGSKQLLQPTKFTEEGMSMLYDPPIDEFSVLKIELDQDGSTTHRAIEGPSLCLVTEGEGTVSWSDGEETIRRGDVVFVGADKEVKWAAGERLEVFRAFVEAGD